MRCGGGHLTSCDDGGLGHSAGFDGERRGRLGQLACRDPAVNGDVEDKARVQPAYWRRMLVLEICPRANWI
jgi:hypothetical protein